jgi:hypothetical protein
MLETLPLSDLRLQAEGEVSVSGDPTVGPTIEIRVSGPESLTDEDFQMVRLFAEGYLGSPVTDVWLFCPGRNFEHLQA